MTEAVVSMATRFRQAMVIDSRSGGSLSFGLGLTKRVSRLEVVGSSPTSRKRVIQRVDHDNADLRRGSPLAGESSRKPGPTFLTK